MEACALTDTGQKRSMNQDFIYASKKPIGSLENLFIVADGMGGHQAGDFASRFVVENLVRFFETPYPDRDVHGILKEPEIRNFAIKSLASFNVCSGDKKNGSVITPFSERLTLSTSSACASIDMFL